MYVGKGGIVKNPDAFDENFIQDGVPQRAEHIMKLFYCISPAVERKTPMHVWIHGKPGTGKTMTSKFFLKLLKEKYSIPGIYINCWECRTLFAILDRLILELKILGADKPDARFKLERLKRFLGSKPFVLVLDEIDQPSPKERSSIIYNFINLGNVGLICISYSRQTYYDLDNRVKSRLSPQLLEFELYQYQDLISILRERAEAALVPNSWNREDLESIALLSKGDVRIAIQTLKNAAYWAQEEGADNLVYQHIQNGVNKARKLKKKYLLKKLTKDHRILYGIIKERGEILSGHLWELYLKACSEKNIKPIAPRTYSMYINRLRDLGLIDTERAKVRGKVRVFRTVD